MWPWWPGLVCTGRHLLHEPPRGLWLSVGVNHPGLEGWCGGDVWTGASASRLPHGSWPLCGGSWAPEWSLPLTVRFCQGRTLRALAVFAACWAGGAGCSAEGRLLVPHLLCPPWARLACPWLQPPLASIRGWCLLPILHGVSPPTSHLP